MDQLGRWHKRTTDVALRLGELSVRLRTNGGGDDYLKRRYGGRDGEPDAPEEGPPADAEEAELLEDDATSTTPAPEPAPAEDPPAREDAA